MAQVKVYSKAERATLAIANMKVDKANAFYNYHKEIIDEYYRLVEDASCAQSNYNKARMNVLDCTFLPKNKV